MFTAKPLQYALVAYVRNEVGWFVEELRQELYPKHAHLPAHVTVLPPRYLPGTEDEARQELLRQMPNLVSFEIALGAVETFCPTTPTVFLRVEYAAYRFREMHDQLNTASLFCPEQWPYMPHMTVVKMPELCQAEAAVELVRKKWSAYRGPRTATIAELAFVREGKNNQWLDLLTVPLVRPASLSFRDQ